METTRSLRCARSRRVNAGPVVIANLGGRPIPMRIERLERSFVVLRANTSIPAHAVLELHIYLSRKAPPLRITGTCSLVQRRWDAYSLGIELSGMSTETQRTWAAFCEQSFLRNAASSATQLRSLLHVGAHVVLLVGSRFSERTRTLLSEAGCAVEAVAELRAAEQRVQAGDVRAVVVDAGSAASALQAFCANLKQSQPEVVRVLLSQDRGPYQLDHLLHLGASTAIARPVSSTLLAARILDSILSEVAERSRESAESPASEPVEANEPSLLQRLSSWASQLMTPTPARLATASSGQFPGLLP